MMAEEEDRSVAKAEDGKEAEAAQQTMGTTTTCRRSSTKKKKRKKKKKKKKRVGSATVHEEERICAILSESPCKALHDEGCPTRRQVDLLPLNGCKVRSRELALFHWASLYIYIYDIYIHIL